MVAAEQEAAAKPCDTFAHATQQQMAAKQKAAVSVCAAGVAELQMLCEV